MHPGLTNAWSDAAQCMPPGMPPSMTSTCPVTDSARQNMTTCSAILCPSERFSAQRGRRHQPLTARAGQMMRLVVRWLPEQEIAFVADSCFAVLELLDKVQLRSCRFMTTSHLNIQ